jgi:HlyD family secretion protein
MKAKRIQAALVAVLVLVVAGGAAWFWLKPGGAPSGGYGGGPGGPGGGPGQPGAPETARVERATIRKFVESTGRVVSNLDVEIKCKASGEIINLPFDISDPVKKGDLILELDPVDQLRNLQQVEASVAGSRARLEQARVNLAAAEKNLEANRARAQAALAAAEARSADADAKARRDANLLEQKHVSVEEAETSRTAAAEARANVGTARAQVEAIEAEKHQIEALRQDIHLAEVQIESDQAALDLARQRLTETKILSPIDGVISARPVQIGQIISSGISNVGGGTSVMTVSDLSRIFVLASVDESDIGGVSVGQEARITADAFPGERFSGTVQRIASAGTNLTNVVTFEVKIEVTSENKSLLKPEMTANVTIQVAEAENVLSVPLRALVRREGETFLLRGDGRPGAEPQQVPVVLGISDGELLEVKEGVNEGDQVLLVRAADESRWRNNAPRRMPSLFGGPRR